MPSQTAEGTRSSRAGHEPHDHQVDRVEQTLNDRPRALAARREGREAGGHRVVQPQAPLPGQGQHRRRGRHDLGQRGQVEHGAHGHRAGRARCGVGLPGHPGRQRGPAPAHRRHLLGVALKYHPRIDPLGQAHQGEGFAGIE